MPTQVEYALFSAHVYGRKDRDYVGPSADIRHSRNTVAVPDGWVLLGEPSISNDGFMAQAYRRGNEIVISYAGTTDEVNPLTSIANNDWLWGNVPAGTALALSPQLVNAAKFYLDVLAANPTAQISFTGHSLGGGLASLMAVYFNWPAVVFNEAPFLKSADSSTIVDALRQRLQQDGYVIPAAFASYSAIDPTGALIPSATRLAREHLVQQIYTAGEILSLPITQALSVASVLLSREMIEMDPRAQSILGWGVSARGTSIISGHPTDLHSMTLLAGFGMQQGFSSSSPFLRLVQDYPEILPRMFAGMFKNEPKSEDTNLLDMLVTREYRGEDSETLWRNAA